MRDAHPQAAALPGFLAALLVIVIGRETFAIASSTLSGWSALFFVALFTGFVVFYIWTHHSYATKFQATLLAFGGVFSLISLILLERKFDVAGEVLLFLASTLLIFSLFSISRFRGYQETTQERSLTQWALRIDDLLKYDLPAKTKITLAVLIDTLWRSPKDKIDFIPAQNTRFEQLLNELERLVRQGDHDQIKHTINELTQCLADRNSVLQTNINIKYSHVSQHPSQIKKPFKAQRIETSDESGST